MSFPQGSNSEGMHQDAPINIASIIDCFTVLITYVLAAASFISLGAIDAGIAGAPAADAPPAIVAPAVTPVLPTSLHLNIAENALIEMKSDIAGQKANETVADTAIIQHVTDFKTQHPDLKSITLSAADSVPYERMVKLIGSLKENHLPIIFSGNPD
jgi:biopolymer transport protein ExbD